MLSKNTGRHRADPFISAILILRISNGVRGARTFACHVGTRADAWWGTWSNTREIFARSGTLSPYGFSSPPPSHLPAGPMAIPDLASVWELAPGSIPASASPVGRAFVWMDRYLDRAPTTLYTVRLDSHIQMRKLSALHFRRGPSRTRNLFQLTNPFD